MEYMETLPLINNFKDLTVPVVFTGTDIGAVFLWDDFLVLGQSGPVSMGLGIAEFKPEYPVKAEDQVVYSTGCWFFYRPAIVKESLFDWRPVYTSAIESVEGEEINPASYDGVNHRPSILLFDAKGCSNLGPFEGDINRGFTTLVDAIIPKLDPRIKKIPGIYLGDFNWIMDHMRVGPEDVEKAIVEKVKTHFQ